jgi:hypothetical protein
VIDVRRQTDYVGESFSEGRAHEEEVLGRGDGVEFEDGRVSEWGSGIASCGGVVVC